MYKDKWNIFVKYQKQKALFARPFTDSIAKAYNFNNNKKNKYKAG